MQEKIIILNIEHVQIKILTKPTTYVPVIYVCNRKQEDSAEEKLDSCTDNQIFTSLANYRYN